MNNNTKDNYIEVDSRRYSPLTLGNVPLSEAMSQEEIADLLGRFKEGSPTYDIEFVARIGFWILNNGKCDKYKKEDPYKGPKFYELVQSSLTEWRKFIVKEILEMKVSGNDIPIRLTEIAEKFTKKFKSRRTFPDFSRVVTFVEYYRDKNGDRLIDIREIEDEDDYELFPYVEKEPVDDLL